MYKVSKVVLVMLCALGITLSPTSKSQAIKGRRQAYGAERANQVEALLRYLFPGVAGQWDPELVVRDSSGKPTPIDLGDLKTIREKDGTVVGVTFLEVGTDKKDYIEKIKNHRAVSPQTYPTEIIVFRADSSDNIIELRKVLLDSSDPLTEISWFNLQKRPTSAWPLLRLGYESYTKQNDLFAAIAWDSIFDTATGSFSSRIPSGILVKGKDGNQTADMLSVRRASRMK